MLFRSVRRSNAVTDPGDPVRVPIEDALDLHSFVPRDVPSVVGEYIEAAHARGFREVRLIHGRGIGVQRAIVQSLLRGHPLPEPCRGQRVQRASKIARGLRTSIWSICSSLTPALRSAGRMSSEMWL